MRRLALALALAAVTSALALGGCVYEPTQVVVAVGTDVPPETPLTLRVAVVRGHETVFTPVTADRTFRRAAPGEDGGARVPGSFTVIPRPAGPRDERVTVVIEGVTDTAILRRTVRFRFTPRQSLLLRVFLSARCAGADTGCMGANPCTRQALCEERGQTCGDTGECVPIAVDMIPRGGLDAGRRIDELDAGGDGADPFGDGGGGLDGRVPGDGSVDPTGDGSGGGDTGPRDGGPLCRNGACNPNENACNCPEDCPARPGDSCCSPGETNCNEPACPDVCGDGCCSGDETCAMCPRDCGGAASCQCYIRCCGANVQSDLVGPIFLNSGGECAQLAQDNVHCGARGSQRAEWREVCVWRRSTPCPCCTTDRTTCPAGSRWCQTGANCPEF